jgi:tRNA (cmo5U34)-methyltransferase
MAQTDNTTPHPAAMYDQGVRQTVPFYETLHAQTLDLARMVKPDAACWLDTGCGTGYLVELAWPLFPRTRFVLADSSAEMLAQAQIRLKDAGTRVTFLPAAPSEGLAAVCGDLRPEVITAVMCHHYLQPHQRRAAVQACYDVLAPGGLFIVFEHIAPATPHGVEIGLARWKNFLGQSRSPEVAAEQAKRYNTRFFPITVAEHFTLLRSVGFGLVEQLWLAQMQAGFYAVK